MNTLLNSKALTVAIFLCGALMTTDSFARGLYKSVNADGKITYSNHPTADRQTAQHVSLKSSPKFSIAGKSFCRNSSKS